VDNLTPTAQLTLEALKDGPGNVHELRERTGRSRSATDKALAELARADLIVTVDDDSDPADGAPTRWRHAESTPVDADVTHTDQPAADGGTPQWPTDQPDTIEAEHDLAPPEGPAAEWKQTGQPAPDTGDGPQTARTGEESAQAPDVAAAIAAAPVQEERPDGDHAPRPDQPKLCRGCQTQMPTLCEHCWQKTPAYCGQCRKDMPQVRRGEPGEPVILPNGLPKLRPGELEQLVEKVMRDNPLPHHVGVTGWTGGRVAIFLPGRSTGAINNALDKLVKTGVAELIGDRPMRYQLTLTEQPDSGSAEVGAASPDQAAATEKPAGTE
jgi:hypothetical protein